MNVQTCVTGILAVFFDRVIGVKMKLPKIKGLLQINIFFAALISLSTLKSFADQRNRIDIHNIEDFISQQVVAARGIEGKCSSAIGVYKLVLEEEIEVVRFSFVHQSQLVGLDPTLYQSVLRVDRQINGQWSYGGLLIQVSQGWFLALVEKGVTHPYPSMTLLGGTIPAFEYFYHQGQTEFDNVQILSIQFSDDMLFGVGPNLFLEYDSDSTVDAFLQERDSLLNFLERTTVSPVRIPPKMYELIEDESFLEAQRTRHYSKMYDMIFNKALELSNREFEKALFISLITVDLRDRGYCGAIKGRRGHIIVPRGIFDFEVPENSVIGSRFDAAQHFFGYAILSHRFGEKATQTYSASTKTQGWTLVGRFFRKLHFGDDPDHGGDTFKALGKASPSAWYADADLRLRPKYDVDADKHYNRLGIAFGTRLHSNPDLLPSEIINSVEFKAFEQALHLPENREYPWVTNPPESHSRSSVSVLGFALIEILSPMIPRTRFVEGSEISIRPVYNGDTFQACVKRATPLSGSILIAFLPNKECEEFYEAPERDYLLHVKGRNYFLPINN